MKALQRLPGGVIADLLPTPIQTIRLVNGQSRSIFINSRQPLGYVMRREQLDRRLLTLAEQAGATIRGHQRVLGHERLGGLTNVYTAQGRVQTRYLVGADGVHGRTAIDAGVRPAFARWQLAFARVAELRWGRGPDDLPLQQMQLFCLPVLGGLGWVFPLPGGANVGVAASSLDLKRVQRCFDDLLRRLRTQVAPFDLVWQRGAWLPAGGVPRRVTAERTFLIGDAAGFVDCFSGEGIYYAIASGQLAAQAIADSFGDAKQAERYYRRDCGAALLPTLRRSLLLSGLMGRGKARYHQALHRQPQLSTHLLSLMLEERPYHGVMIPLLSAFFSACLQPVARDMADLQVLG